MSSISAVEPTGLGVGGARLLPALTLNISPMTQDLFGTVFAQVDLLSKPACGGASAMLEITSDGTVEAGQFTLATPVLSLVSYSILLFLREQHFGGMIDITITSVAEIRVWQAAPQLWFPSQAGAARHVI